MLSVDLWSCFGALRLLNILETGDCCELERDCLKVAICVAGLDVRKDVVMIILTPISSHDEGDDRAFEDEHEHEGFGRDPLLFFGCGGSIRLMFHRLGAFEICTT